MRRVLFEGWTRPGDLLHAACGIGWEYIHGVIDDHSRVAYVEMLNDQREPPAPRSCAGPWLVHGSWGAHPARSEDNGSSYVARVFRAACTALGVRHLQT